MTLNSQNNNYTNYCWERKNKQGFYQEKHNEYWEGVISSSIGRIIQVKSETGLTANRNDIPNIITTGKTFHTDYTNLRYEGFKNSQM